MANTKLNPDAIIDKSITKAKLATSLQTEIEGKVDNTESGLSEAINTLSTGTATPKDADYFISQYAGGGTTHTTYHRRPFSALWTWIKGKVEALGYAKATDVTSKQDKLVSGSNIKTVNGTSLLGSGNITISGGSGDITAAGNNTFTGNNTFSGETIIKNNIVFNSDGNGNIEVEQTPIGLQLGSNGSEIIVSGVATPVDTLDAANKKYVDDQITAKLGTVLTQLQSI